MTKSKYELVGSVEANPATTITQRTENQTTTIELLQQLVILQSKQNDLLQDIANKLSAAQRQRDFELAQWKRANPVLAQSCKAAVNALGKIQRDFLTTLVCEMDENLEDIQDNEFLLNEFFEKYGPRIAHLNTLMQTLSVFGNAPDLPL